MEKFVFDAIMMDEFLVCNSCLKENNHNEINSAYQDTGVCFICSNTCEVTKPNAAELLEKNGYDLIANDYVRTIFFKTKPI
ncbi:hypothetical protein [Maribacter sp. 2304DJ31-5]|uniref:hypothetical protein n=1 Tax=Maribacter sp. 2304DJ31-5 TaxID=3386273 RepID=UPI0039BC4742